MARRSLISPFSSHFSRFFDEFRDLDAGRPFFQRPYWTDYQFEDSHKLGSAVGEVIVYFLTSILFTKTSEKKFAKNFGKKNKKNSINLNLILRISSLLINKISHARQNLLI